MTWNYRVIKTGRGAAAYYSLHEVYYDGAGKPHSMTQNPIAASGESREELVQVLEMMLRDAKERDVLDGAQFAPKEA